jgi:hypothetical protein
MNLSCFMSYTKNAVMKFSYLLEKVKYARNQYVYTSGQPAENVYIVLKGDFEIETKLVKKGDNNEVKISKMLGI